MNNDSDSVVVNSDLLIDATNDFMEILFGDREYFIELAEQSVLVKDAIGAVVLCYDEEFAAHGFITMHAYLGDGFDLDYAPDIKKALGDALTAVQQLRHAMIQLPTDSKLEETIAKIDTYIVVLRDYNKRFREIIAAGYLYSNF